MKWLAIALGVGACAPCEGQRNVTDGYVSQAQLQPELAKCAGQRVCLDPCEDLFALTPDEQVLACQVTLDGTGGGRVAMTYVDWSVCAADSSDVGGGVYVDDGSWGGGDDGTTDDGSDDTPPDDGSSDDGSSDSGDDGSTERIAPAHHAWSTPAKSSPRL